MTPEREAALRRAVVAEAMTWLGTPHVHRARVKGAGVDCAQLPLAVYAAAGAIEAFEPADYPADWHIHKELERYLAYVLPWAREIDEGDVQPGDLVLCKIGRVYSHGVIVTRWPQGIHADVNIGQVVLCDLDRDVGLISGPRRYFTFKG